MKTLADLEIRKAAMVKAMRTAIRLKYSLMADTEIAHEIPALEHRIHDAWENGEAIEMNPGSVFFTGTS